MHHKTIFTLVAQNTIPNGFPLYPRVHSFTTLQEDHTNRKRLIGTFKDFIILLVKVRRKPFLAYHLILVNEMGNIIHLMLYHIPINLMVSVIIAKHDQSIIFVSRLKLIHEHLNVCAISVKFDYTKVDPKSAKERQKEKKRRLANGEGSSHNTASMTNVSNTEMRILMDITNATPTCVSDVQNVIYANANPTLEDVVIRQSSTSREGFEEDNVNSTVQDHILDDPYDFVFAGIPKTHRVLKSKASIVSCGAIRLQFEFDTFCL
ncbi:hypothetical protein LXL04_023649 [Taraxacum kok-saghyz]